MPPLALEAGEARVFPEPAVERGRRDRELRRPRGPDVFEREGQVHHAALQAEAIRGLAPVLAQDRFDQPRFGTIRDIGLEIDLRLGTDVAGKRRTELDRELREGKARHALEVRIRPGADLFSAIAQLADAR